MALAAGDVVVVSAAAGGVGSLAVQLARRAGARVIGLAASANHAWLREHGINPVAYGDGVAERIREAARRAIDAFIDTFGGGYVDLAVDLGVPPERIDTIIDSPPRSKRRQDRGQRAAATRRGAGGARANWSPRAGSRCRSPRPTRWTGPRRLRGARAGHTHGKIVLVP